MKVMLLNAQGYKDISPLVASITWSGDLQQAARKLEVNLAVSPHDAYLPKITIGLGNMLKLQTDDGVELMQGFVFSQQMSCEGNELQLTAFDGLIYLTKSQMSYNFRDMTAEAITRKVCGDLGIVPGNIIATGINQSCIALAKTGYEIIKTAYTAASRQTGKKYLPMMNQGKLDVIEKGIVVAAYELNNKTNLSNASYSESAENMVNRVVITDEKGNIIGRVQNDQWMKDYGLLQTIYQKEMDKDAAAAASSMLQDLERKASAEALGNTACITGKAVEVREPHTDLKGRFYIDGDTHNWKNGQHTMSLELEWDNKMDTGGIADAG